MLFELLFKNQELFLTIILSIIYALTIHEFAHAWAATALGDQTAKYAGRLSLNPLRHLDFFGTLMLVFAGFGWGKPVPVNVYNLRWSRWGEAVVSLAGPVSNFLSVIFFIILFSWIGPLLPPNNLLFIFLSSLIIVNAILGIFNLIPIPPLDGSKILFAFLPDRFNHLKQQLSVNGIWILLALLILDDLTRINIFGRIIDGFLNIIYYFL